MDTLNGHEKPFAELFREEPQALRRLVLLLYAVVGPVFGLLLFLEADRELRPLALATGAFLVLAGAASLRFRGTPTQREWVVSVAVVPTVCCGIGFAASSSVAGPVFLSVVGAPLACAAAYLRPAVVWTALVTAVVTCFAAITFRDGPLAAAVDTAFFGTVSGLVAWVIHRKAEALRGAQRELSLVAALVRRMSDAVIVTDPGLVVHEYTGDAQRIYGWSREEALGRNLGTDFVSEFPEGDRDVVLAALDAGLPVRSRMRALRKDGTWASLDLSAAPLRDDAGRLTGWLSVSRDIGPQVAAELALRTSERRLAVVLDGADEGFWDWDFPSQRVDFSARWASILGYQLADLPPHLDTWKRLVHPDDVERVTAAARRSLAPGAPPYHDEYRMRHRDGRWVWVLVRGKVVERDGQGAPVRLAGTCMDIAARHDAEEARRAALEENEKLVGELRGALAEVKALSGLLPICMYCKNVRDDEGYWKRIETYISSRTSAQFSHGLCPDCFTKHFPPG